MQRCSTKHPTNKKHRFGDHGVFQALTLSPEDSKDLEVLVTLNLTANVTAGCGCQLGVYSVQASGRAML